MILLPINDLMVMVNVMPKKPIDAPQFESLSWDDLVAWAGSKIALRGRGYQREGRVKNLAVTEDRGILASVDGSERYAVQVHIDEEGILESQCTCPYEFDCKHAVAAVLEYLACVDQDKTIPRADPTDERLAMVNDNIDDENLDVAFGPTLPEEVQTRVDVFLNEKTKPELIDLMHSFMRRYPKVASELQETIQLRTGNVAAVMSSLRRELREISNEPGWRNHWDDEGFTPDYSGIRNKLENLLASGHPDEVLVLGKELIASGTRQVEMSNDEGETAEEISSCISSLPHALAASSLPEAERLLWAMDVVLDDEFDLCSDLAEYLRGKHPNSAWDTVADILLKRLASDKSSKKDCGHTYKRDRISDWAIYALEQAARVEEIIPLCEAEAGRTKNYERLVDRLIASGRYKEAERWIQEGLRATSKEHYGTSSSLREAMLTIRTRQHDWAAVASLQVELFVRAPSTQAFEKCKGAGNRLKAWPTIRRILLEHLASGQLPWIHPEWTLPVPSWDAPTPLRRDSFPRLSTLIEIAIHEKRPEDVLRWYDQRSKRDRYGFDSLEDAVATAVESHAPDRAVAIWKSKAERAIALVKPSAYNEAATYLRKAAKVMVRERKEAEWSQYLTGLRMEHVRKRRLIEVLDTLSARPIVKKQR